MNYEQKYKDALERAKEIIECSKSDTKDVRMVLSFFPELKESREDEMIRIIKEVILNSVPYKINILTKDTTITAEEAIAWLEKQREQMQELLTKEKALKNSPFVEQKPWSEEDQMMLQYTIEHFESQKRNCIGGGGRKKEMQEFINWLKSLEDRVLPLPRQEYDDMAYEMARAVLYDQLKDSLRHKWKPSEEQMKVLNEVINFAADHGTMRWNDYIYNVLKGLREQLKKL